MSDQINWESHTEDELRELFESLAGYLPSGLGIELKGIEHELYACRDRIESLTDEPGVVAELKKITSERDALRAEKAQTKADLLPAEVTRLREVLKLAKDTIMVLKPRGLKLDREQAEMTLGRLAAELEGE